MILDGSHFSWHHINAGVPQGSVLAPTIFLLNINDLLDSTSNSIHSYADDSSVHCSFCFAQPPSRLDVLIGRERAVVSLNADLVAVSRWGDVNRTTFNSVKTQYIAFTNRAPITESSIQFIDSSILCSSSIDT